VIIPSPSIEHPFVLNTSRLGIDFEHNGSALKITVRYCKVEGSHDAVRGLFQGRIEPVPLSDLEVQNTSVMPFDDVSNLIRLYRLEQLNDRT